MKKWFYRNRLLFVVFACCALVTILITPVFQSIRWDKIPVVGAFVLGINQPFGVDAGRYVDPIMWDELDEEPEDWPPSQGYWFNHINGYTRRLLKRYMKENTLAIVPRDYVVDATITFEELLEVLEFEVVDAS